MRRDLIQVRELEERILEKDIPSPIVLYGDETFLIVEAGHRIIQTILPDKEEGLNYVKWQGEGDRYDKFLEDLLSYSLFAQQRLFHLSCGDLIFGKNSSLRYRKPLEEILKRGLPSGNILLIASPGALNKSLNVTKAITKSGGILIEFPEFKTYHPGDPQRDETYPYLQERLRVHEVEIAPDAFFELRKRTPANLWALTAEVDKLLTYSGPKNTINREVVEVLTPRNKSDQIFDLTDAITARRMDEALAIFNNVVRHEANVLGIHQLLVQHMHSILMARQWLKRVFKGNLPREFSYRSMSQNYLRRWNEQLQKKEDSTWDFLLKRHPYILFKTLLAAPKFQDDELLGFLTAMEELENTVKSRIFHHAVRIEMIIMELCRE